MFLKSIRHTAIGARLGIALLTAVLVFCFLSPPKSAAADEQKAIAENSQEIKLPDKLSPQAVDAFMGSLSDEQVRTVLARKLKQEAVNEGSSAGEEKEKRKAGQHFDLFYKMEQGIAVVKTQINSSFSGMTASSGQWADAFARLSAGKGVGHLLLMLLIAAVIMGGGLVVERLLLRFTEDLRQQLLTAVPLAKLQRLGRFISRLLLDALGVVLYMLTTFILFVMFYDRGESGHGFVSKILIISYYFRVIMFAAKVLLSPASPALRLLPLQDDDARFLYRWFFQITLILAFFAAPGLIFRNVGGSEKLFMQIYSVAGISITLLLIAMVWQSRQRVAQAIYPHTSIETTDPLPMRARFAKSWHYFAFLYVIGIGAYWTLNVLISGRGEIIRLIASLFLVPIFIGLDQWVQRLLKMASGELPETIVFSDDDEDQTSDEQPPDSKMHIKHYVPLINRSFRVVLLAFLFFMVLRLWGIDLPIGRLFTSHALNIIVTLIIGFFVWEFTKARIDRKLKEEMPEQDEDAEEGGAGGSRSGTLLLLLRKFLLAVMFIIVCLTILSSLGVNIGPLIAGAGVVGLAIGFGAQTLVKDIIAGIFFLIDDAFRVGDYVETAGTKGMVEHISLRSLRIRHPRGMVYTIPFGGMGSVTNFSRDYIITKLDIRVRYDADTEKIRKIVKRISRELENDEEIGPVLLDKIKSQGVREMDDSAMILRVKFKTIPGEQFIVRREVFRRIQESFRENGIEFAHRNVTVYLPPETGEGQAAGKENGEKTAKKPDRKLVEAGAAAAIAAAQEEEAAKKEPKP